MVGDMSRRAVMAGVALGGATVAGRAIAAPVHLGLDDIKKEGEVAALYHCDFGDAARFEQTLNNISNHYSAYNGDPFALQLAIIAHGGGIKFFLDNLENTQWKDEKLPAELFERAASLSKNGLKVHLCEITFKRNKLDPSRAKQADFISFVPSGVATVAALQTKGFAYVKVG